MESKIILSYKIGLGQSLKDQSIHIFLRNEVLPNVVPFKDNLISNKVLAKIEVTVSTKTLYTGTLGPAYNE